MSTSSKVSAGSEILYHCSRCDLDLWHTVVAAISGKPARVRCNTCKSERNYRDPSTKGREKPAVASRPRIVGAHPDLYQKKLKEALMNSPKTYRADQEFAENDVVDHPSFGRGIVLKLIFPDRMDVLFQDETKTLIRKASS